MNRTPVDSSMLRNAGYDAIEHVLEVEYRSGEVYQYFDVPQDIYDGLMAAESKGTFMNIYVLPTYRFSRVRKSVG